MKIGQIDDLILPGIAVRMPIPGLWRLPGAACTQGDDPPYADGEIRSFCCACGGRVRLAVGVARATSFDPQLPLLPRRTLRPQHLHVGDCASAQVVIQASEKSGGQHAYLGRPRRRIRTHRELARLEVFGDAVLGDIGSDDLGPSPLDTPDRKWCRPAALSDQVVNRSRDRLRVAVVRSGP